MTLLNILFCLFATISQSHEGVMTRLQAPSHSCEGKHQLGIIGKFENVDACAHHISEHPDSCPGKTFMFANGYGMHWGCRCCTSDPSGWTHHNIWKIYQLPVEVSLAAPGKSCEGAHQKGMITKSFQNAQGCGRYLNENPNLCPQKTFMLAGGYGTSWGCRCCTSDPNGWTAHNLWKIYQTPADVTLEANGKSCEGPNQKGTISKSFAKAEDCGRYVAENPNVCPDKTFMFANGYGTSWGCRCCTSNPSGWTPHNYWKIYQSHSSGVAEISFPQGHLLIGGAFLAVMGVGYWFAKRQRDSAELSSLLDGEFV